MQRSRLWYGSTAVDSTTAPLLKVLHMMERNLSEYGDVVVVTVNHRLNALGYLDLSDYGEDYQYSGNCGTADLVASLKWVKENIANFGGDPDNVTIFGQSGGGCKVLNMFATSEAEGLFNQAIVQSGSERYIEKDTAKKITEKNP